MSSFDDYADSQIKREKKYWKSETSKERGPAGPRGKICYICGRTFGTASLAIHQPVCIKKRELEQSRLPPHQRTPLGPDPYADMPDRAIGGNGEYDLDAYNAAAQAAYEANMVPCPNCGRTFANQLKVEKHMKLCKGAAPMKKGAARPSTSQGAGRSPSVGASGGSSGGGGAMPSAASARPKSASSAGVSARPVRRKDSTGAKVRPDDLEDTVGLSDTMKRDEMRRQLKQGSSTGPPTRQASSGGLINRSSKAAAMFGDEDEAAAAAAAAGPLDNCQHCGRRFAVDRLERHEAACARASSNEQKREKLLARKQMQQARSGGGSGGGGSSSSAAAAAAASKPKSNWREKHEEFIETVRANKRLTKFEQEGGNLADLPPPPPSANPDYIQCPHCQRRFNETAARRHIPSCANIVNKPKPPPHLRGDGGGGGKSPTPKTSSVGGGGGGGVRPPSASKKTKASVTSGGGGGSSKFCGECGTPFLKNSTKFCGECGTKR